MNCSIRLPARRVAPLASPRRKSSSRVGHVARVSAPFEEHQAISGLSSTFRNRNVTKQHKRSSDRGNVVLQSILDCVQVASILTVLAIQFGLAIQKIQAQRCEAAVQTSFSRGKALKVIEPSPPSPVQEVAEFQPTFLVLALGAALMSKLFGPKECAAVRCASLPTSARALELKRPQCPLGYKAL